MAPLRVGIVACSSPVGPLELELGVRRLRAAGFDPVVHPNVLKRHFVTAGTDHDRAQSFLDFAFDDTIDILWCARGGYGAARVIPKLAAASLGFGSPKPKMLVGYSDVTVLHEYVRKAWGWKTLHAPMISESKTQPTTDEWATTYRLARGEPLPVPYTLPVRWMTSPPDATLAGDLVGGNLSLWTSMAGTPWQPDPRGKILFFEDIGEALYRIDRMVVQLEQSDMLKGAAAIVLGDFTDCNDESPTMLDPGQSPDCVDWTKRVPMRPTLSLRDGITEIFGRVAERFAIPLAMGLPVGHGPNFFPLMLGESHQLTADGKLVFSQYT